MNARMKLTGLGLAAMLTLLSGAVLRGPATPALGASVSAGVPAGAVITQTFSGVTGQTSETVAYNANGPSAGPPAIPAPATQTLAGTNLTRALIRFDAAPAPGPACSPARTCAVKVPTLPGYPASAAVPVAATAAGGTSNALSFTLTSGSPWAGGRVTGATRTAL